MTRKDFKESLDAVLVEHLEESLTPAELSKLSRDIVARVDIDWEPFQDEDPLDIASEGEAENETPSFEEVSYVEDEED
jgi:hypothetical protein